MPRGTHNRRPVKPLTANSSTGPCTKWCRLILPPFSHDSACLKRECHDNQWFFSHFVWGKIMAATRKDRAEIHGQAAHRRTAEWWPRSDRGQAGRSNFFKLSLQLGARWLFCRLLTGGLTLSAAKLRTWENISLPTLAPTLKRFFGGVVKRRLAFFFFFFFGRTTIVASLDGQQDVQCSKLRLLAERSWTDGMQGPWASPSNVRCLRAGRPHNLPQVRLLSLQVFVT